jgi:hypothetical protein
MNGICTLANDRVYDQLVALLNSIEVMLGKDFPVCVYPYDNNLERVIREIDQRPNVYLYQELDSIERWESFARKAWDSYPKTLEKWNSLSSDPYYRLSMHRRFCAFDGPFEKFIYMDADTLLLNSVEIFFDKLDQYGCVVYDYQYKEIEHVFEKSSLKLTEVFTPSRLSSEIFCAGVYASRRGLFDDSQREILLNHLIANDSEVLYPMAPDQSLLNYMMMKFSVPFYNFALHLPEDKRVGNCVTSRHFVERDGLLYDKGNRLNYLHYIGLSSSLFERVCLGDNIDFPYRELFLHYRYLHEPEKRPQFTEPPFWYQQPPTFKQRALNKLKRIVKFQN